MKLNKCRRQVCLAAVDNSMKSPTRNTCSWHGQTSGQVVPNHCKPYLLRCPAIPTELAPLDLWRRPVLVADLLREWQTALEAG